ncbi:MAG: FAD-binding oxidoreductase [Actinomycetota bacterium]|nr:FAD-binding oxidoreductase [Actinomycetota bacterium]
MPTVDPDSANQQTWESESRFGRRAEVVAVHRLTVTGTVLIDARVTDDQPFDYLPGQFVAIEEDVPSAGRQHSPYCLFNPPDGGREFRMLVRVFPEGPLSHYLASMRPGTPLHFRGPSGRSLLPRQPDWALVLLATGVGLSPCHSLVAHLLRAGDRRRIRLFWGVRLVEDVCLTDELDALAAAHPNFRYHISLSQPEPGWTGLRGRLTESVPPLLDHLGDTVFYLAGNGAMAEEMELALSGMGVDRTYIHQERFFNVRHTPEPGTVDAILDRFVADDLDSPHLLQQAPLLFQIDRDVHGRSMGPPPG